MNENRTPSDSRLCSWAVNGYACKFNDINNIDIRWIAFKCLGFEEIMFTSGSVCAINFIACTHFVNRFGSAPL